MSRTRHPRYLRASQFTPHPVEVAAPRPRIDVAPARAAVRALFTWACDVARAFAPEPDDREAIDRVERYALTLVAGQPVCCLPPDVFPSQADVLITASAMIDALAVDLGAPWAAELFGVAYAAMDRALRVARPSPVAPPAARSSGLGAVAALINAWIPRAPVLAVEFDDDGDVANDNERARARRARRARRAGGRS